jgi:hypothetical protein
VGNSDLVRASCRGGGNGEREGDEEGRGGRAPVHRDGAEGEARSVRQAGGGGCRRGEAGPAGSRRSGGQPAGRPACGVGMAEELKRAWAAGPPDPGPRSLPVPFAHFASGSPLHLAADVASGNFFWELSASGNWVRRVWESSNLKKIAPELQIHEIPPWSSSTVDLGSRKTFGAAPDFTSSL